MKKKTHRKEQDVIIAWLNKSITQLHLNPLFHIALLMITWWPQKDISFFMRIISTFMLLFVGKLDDLTRSPKSNKVQLEV